MEAESSGPRDALELLRLVARSWKVALPLLTATAVVTALVVASVPMHYRATGRVIVESPAPAPPRPGAGEAQDGNPFAQFNPALSIVGEIIAQVVDDDVERDALEKRGAARDYTVEANDLWDAPVLVIQAVSREPAEATHTVQIVAEAISDELVVQQTAAGADPDAFLTVRALIAPAIGAPLYGGRARSGLACLLLGIGVTIALTVFLDARRRAQLARRRWPPIETSERILPRDRSAAGARS